MQTPCQRRGFNDRLESHGDAFNDAETLFQSGGNAV